MSDDWETWAGFRYVRVNGGQMHRRVGNTVWQIIDGGKPHTVMLDPGGAQAVGGAKSVGRLASVVAGGIICGCMHHMMAIGMLMQRHALMLGLGNQDGIGRDSLHG